MTITLPIEQIPVSFREAIGLDKNLKPSQKITITYCVGEFIEPEKLESSGEVFSNWDDFVKDLEE